LEKINPEISEGADGLKDDLLIVAKKGGKLLRNALTRDVADGQIVYITNDTEAYAQYLETIGKFDTIALVEFNNELEKGRIKDDSEKATFIKDIREDVKEYFMNGGDEPERTTIFSKALQHLGKEQLALEADDSAYVSNRNVMSGGYIALPEDVSVESDDINISSNGNGRYTVGDGYNEEKIVFLKIQNGNIFKFVPLNIKPRQITQLAKQNVTPQQGGTLGDEGESISLTIPPFALDEEKEITLQQIESDGETADGKVILDMLPSGLRFEIPVTVKINYADFGIDDPNTVQWQYGSTEGGYEDADIVSINTTDQLICLSISHFSDLIVKTISKQEFLDLNQ